MPTNSEVENRYVIHGLATIRVANALAREVDGDLVKLSKAIRILLASAGLSTIARRELTALLKEIDTEVSATYAGIAASQSKAIREFMGIEDSFAVKAGDYPKGSSPTVLESAINDLLVLGAKPAQQWAKMGEDLSFRIASEVRQALSANASEKDVIDRVIGTGKRGQERGGIMESARRNAKSLVDTTVHSAANTARMATFKANGVDAVKWHAILDPKVCPYCGVHAGKLYTLDGKPIGHEIALGKPPPAHWWCRCILTPQKYPDDTPPADGGADKDSFMNWLNKQPKQLQDDVLGTGRADLYRKGVITLPDLINQNGRITTLAELKAGV